MKIDYEDILANGFELTDEMRKIAASIQPQEYEGIYSMASQTKEELEGFYNGSRMFMPLFPTLQDCIDHFVTLALIIGNHNVKKENKMIRVQCIDCEVARTLVVAVSSTLKEPWAWGDTDPHSVQSFISNLPRYKGYVETALIVAFLSEHISEKMGVNCDKALYSLTTLMNKASKERAITR